MQHSSLVLFCDECGLANDLEATHCSACQHPLAYPSSATPSSAPVAPITITPPPVLEVTPGPLLAAGSQVVPVQQMPASRHAAGDFRRGTVLNRRYLIQEEIGRGGFSVVYRAQDLNAHRREVVIKRIQLSALTPRQVIDATETFNREITMLARFKSVPGIPAFYEHLTDAENWYLIMQYIEGQTLEDYLQKTPGGYLDEQKTLELGIGFARIMQNLHRLSPPVIFRDLKPANIMITPDENLFLIDFGIARVFTPGKKKDTTPLGSPGYAAPEQYGRGQTGQRSDIYSLGATLQTMLTGRDPLELRAGEPSRNPKPPSPTLRKLLDEMLAPDVTQRPANMAQIEKRLQTRMDALQTRPLLMYLVGLVYGAVVGAIGLIALFTGFGNGWAFWPSYLVGLVIRYVVWPDLRKKLGLQKTPLRFLILGIFTIVSPVLLIWFLRTGWPF